MVLLTHDCCLVSSRLGASGEASGPHVGSHDMYSADLRHPNPAEYCTVRECTGRVSRRIFYLVGIAHDVLVFDDGQRSTSFAIIGPGHVHEVFFFCTFEDLMALTSICPEGLVFWGVLTGSKIKTVGERV